MVELNPLIAAVNHNVSLGIVIVLGVALVLTSTIRHLTKMDHRLVRAFVAMRVVRLLRPKKGNAVSPKTIEKVLKALAAEADSSQEEPRPDPPGNTGGSSPSPSDAQNEDPPP